MEKISNFNAVKPDKISNIFELIGEKWMLITAAKNDGTFNTMTASWGGMGIMWSKPVASCVVRPVRYTYEFIEQADCFTLSFFPEEYRKALNILGTKSGRNGDKIKESGLTVLKSQNENENIVSFEEAETILICKKLYYQDINPANFITKDLDKNYPSKDYHRMYVGEIIKAFEK
jgi:flavin reductase (DIM6/NTAB) family NADH-FMN oxidoreductase RutF